ncbi:hypothetical protein Tcur_1138 [Thermomonospora curvata DSM 43183]|uniref:Uncharacterized protein n=1 Tax=Thermomonospora curvata (strain ATCC 19995 / DSM 43183 / JCM 3096 / KCTC 9072 / NBRC 15933 / NCIMB 10081 / Henssen B9) TaxID=471852 RepID=D1A8M8_THECD|nr:hypothetical protein Tcur_1138 [Thermomonospora curvata DSM 43183]
MKHLSLTNIPIKPHGTFAIICASCIALASCSSDTDPPKAATATPTPGRSTTTSPPAPNYSLKHIKENLIPPKEVTEGLREIKVKFLGVKEGKVASCSMSEVELPGEPEVITRQFIKSGHPPTETHYIQLIARYNAPQGAHKAFQKIQIKARSCPPKQDVPPRRTTEGTTILPHKDTWQTKEGTIEGWQYLRGHERREVPRSMTRYNVYFMMYDYAVRGNVLVCTYYSERREPGKSGDPIAKRATEILTKQLKMFN